LLSFLFFISVLATALLFLNTETKNSKHTFQKKQFESRTTFPKNSYEKGRKAENERKLDTSIMGTKSWKNNSLSSSILAETKLKKITVIKNSSDLRKLEGAVAIDTDSNSDIVF